MPRPTPFLAGPASGCGWPGSAESSFPSRLCGFAAWTKRLHVLVAAAGVSLGLLGGCAPPNQYQPPPPPTVTVARPLQQTVTHYLEETGTTEAFQYVEVRARVKGFLQSIHFEPGDEVKKGDLLYVIDPKPYQATVDQRKASLAVARAELAKAEADLRRAEALLPRQAMSQEEFDERKATRDVKQAAIAEAQAALDEALLDLGYTQVTSPIDGRVGKTLVYEGNLVGAGEATHLTTVVKYAPIYVTFNISEQALQRILDSESRQEGGEIDKQEVKMYLRRANDKEFRYAGHFDYADLAVDESTGTYMVRGLFPNSDQRIIPGMFVRIRVPIGEQEGALLVPEIAVGTDQAGKYLLVVDGQPKVKRRDVTVGTKVEEFVVIEEGLSPDEWVIIAGVQRARPGAEVKTEQTQLTPPKQAGEVVEQGTGPLPEDVSAQPEAGDQPPAPAPKAAPPKDPSNPPAHKPGSTVPQ